MVLALLIILGSLFQSLALFRTVIAYRLGIGYWGPLARDGVWHEALVGQLTKALPPLNPGLAGVELKNYHYFYDLLVAESVNLTGISTRFFIYVFYPILFSLLLGVGTYLLANKLFKDKLTSIVAVFLVYFASSFGWIVELIKTGSAWGGESAFWANQPVSMNLNPPFAISLVFVIFISLLLFSYIQNPKKLTGFFLILLSGVLIGFKAYAGVLVLGGLLGLTLKRALVNKNLTLVPIFAFSFFLSLLIYLPQNSGSYGLFKVQPFWLVDTMIDAGDRVGIANFTARRFAYLGAKKWLHYGILQTLTVTIFLVGNLGTRLVGLAGIQKKQIRSDTVLFILLMALGAIVLPLVFIQKGNAWNIVQFFYYFLYFASLWAASGAVRIYRLFPRFGWLWLVFFILITPISSLSTFRSSLYPNPPAYLPFKEYEALAFLAKQPGGVVLKHPYDNELRLSFKDPFPLALYADNAYVSAYSQKQVFIEDVEQQLILGTDYEERLAMVNQFFEAEDVNWSNSFLQKENIDYLYLPKLYFLPRAEEEYTMKKIFENEEVNIYKVE